MEVLADAPSDRCSLGASAASAAAAPQGAGGEPASLLFFLCLTVVLLTSESWGIPVHAAPPEVLAELHHELGPCTALAVRCIHAPPAPA